jgi:hypothetical protein
VRLLPSELPGGMPAAKHRTQIDMPRNDAPGKVTDPSLSCPRCDAELTPGEVKSLFGKLMGARPRPKAQGVKRPGIGGRPKKEKQAD